MGKQSDRTFCAFLNDGVIWQWRTRPNRKHPEIEDRECIILCSGNTECIKKLKGGWRGKGLEGAKPKNDCPICKENTNCEDCCY